MITAKGVVAPFPIIRNEELILRRAEANINLGNLAAAEADINLVRQVSGQLGPVTLSAGNALDQVLHELRYSLFNEGHRWIDLRRYGRLNTLPLDRGLNDAGDGRGPDVVIPQMPIPSAEAQ